MEQGNNKIWVFVIVALLAGGGGGYYFGLNTGVAQGNDQGRTELLAEQKAAKDKEKEDAKTQITEKANPFSQSEEANPLEGAYENPFEGAAANPFRQ
jgi:hypothetical protein